MQEQNATPWPDDNLTTSQPDPLTSTTISEASQVFPYKTAAWLLTLIFGCVTAGLITTGMAFFTDWQPGLLLPLLLLAFVAGFYGRIWLLERWHVQDRPYSKAVVVAELVLLVLVARIGAYLVSLGQLATDLNGLLTDPIRLVSGTFAIYFFSMLVAWYLGRQGSQQVGFLYLRPFEINNDTEINSQMLFEADRRAAFNSVTSCWRWGAFVMVLLTVFALFYKNQTLNVGPLAFRPQLLTLTTLYFIVGLLWNAWGRMRYLRTMWQSRSLTEPPHIMTRWSRYLLALLALAAIPAVLLPGGYSLNPLDWLNWLLSLFGTGPQGRPQNLGKRLPPIPMTIVPPTIRPPIQNKPQTPTIDLSWLPIVAFWVITVLLLIYAVRVLASTGLGRFQIPNFFLTRWLGAGWNYVLGFFRFNLRFSQLTAATNEEAINTDDRSGLFDFLRPDRPPKDPRARIRYYYKKLLRKGAKNGLARGKGMAPEEYARYLQSQVANPDEAAPDLYNLTSHFTQARYSLHPVSEQQAQAAEQIWQKLEPQIEKPKPPAETD